MKKLSLAVLALSFVMGQAAFATSEAAHKTMSPTAVTATPANDMMHDHHQMHHCLFHMKKMMHELNLDKAQQDKIKSIKDELKVSQKSNWDQMRGLHKQVHEIIQSNTLDNAKLDQVVDQKKELLGRMMKAHITAKQQMYNVLNDKQKAKLNQMMQQCDAKNEHFHE
ncbi:MAG: Spy/CpxP family protein refolding chaperone [Legionella sp.]|nr:Spy/CpxP family protein refolding chaperone [Legionella sp.]